MVNPVSNFMRNQLSINKWPITSYNAEKTATEHVN